MLQSALLALQNLSLVKSPSFNFRFIKLPSKITQSIKVFLDFCYLIVVFMVVV